MVYSFINEALFQIAVVADVNGTSVGDIVRVSLGMGFVVASLVEAFGSFGGVNINPAVTVGLALIAKITILRGKYRNILIRGRLLDSWGWGRGGYSFLWKKHCAANNGK